MPKTGLALPDRHGYHGKCTVCGWEGLPGQSRGRAVGEYVRHQRQAHPEGTTQIGVTRKDG